MNQFNSVIIFDQNQSDWPNLVNNYIKKINITYSPSHPDIIYINQQTGWGINQIKSIKKLITTPPIKASKRLIIIHQAENLTIEAQNSFLKTLEEPPTHTHFLLLTANLNALLDTVKSRCQIIKTTPSKSTPKQKSLSISPDLSKNLQYSTQIGQDKLETTTLIKNQIQLFQKQLIKSPDQTTAHHIRLLQKSLDMIQSNVNSTSALDFFYLSI